jgi:hypothetical protein
MITPFAANSIQRSPAPIPVTRRGRVRGVLLTAVTERRLETGTSVLCQGTI